MLSHGVVLQPLPHHTLTHNHTHTSIICVKCMMRKGLEHQLMKQHGTIPQFGQRNLTLVKLLDHILTLVYFSFFYSSFSYQMLYFIVSANLLNQEHFLYFYVLCANSRILNYKLMHASKHPSNEVLICRAYYLLSYCIFSKILCPISLNIGLQMKVKKVKIFHLVIQTFQNFHRNEEPCKLYNHHILLCFFLLGNSK